MMIVVLALGLVFAVEGLVLALMPRRLDDLAELLAKVSYQQRRGLGLAALAFGVTMVWVASKLG
jgi:uncharacterized protein YjeT (DUF2065 family)